MNVIIKYGADLSNFEQGTDSVEQSIKNTTKSANEFSKTLSSGINNIAIGSMAKQFDALDKSIKEISKDGKITAKELADIKKQANDVGKELGESVKKGDLLKLAKDAETTTKQFTSLKAELRFLKQQITSGELQGKDLEKATLRAAKLTDEIGDLSIKLRTLSSDTRVFDTMVEGARLAAGAFSVAQGAISLFGVENENLQKALIKLNAVMAISQGLQELQTLTQKETAIGTAINTASTWLQTTAQTAYNVVVGTSVGLTKAFRLALAGTGIGLVVFALYELITNFKKVSEFLGLATDKTAHYTKAQKEFAEVNKHINNIRDESVKSSSEELSKLVLLGNAIKDVNLPMSERLKALKQYNALADEGNKIDEKQINNSPLIESSIKRQTDLILQQAMVLSAQKEIQKIAESSLQARIENASIEKSYGSLLKLSSEEINKLVKANDQLAISFVNNSVNYLKNAGLIQDSDNKIRRLVETFGLLDNATKKEIKVGKIKIKAEKINLKEDLNLNKEYLELLDDIAKKGMVGGKDAGLTIPVYGLSFKDTKIPENDIDKITKEFARKYLDKLKFEFATEEFPQLLRDVVSNSAKMIEDGNLQQAFSNVFNGVAQVLDSLDRKSQDKVLGIMQGALQMAQGITNVLDAVLEKQIANLDKLIDKQKDRVNKASDIAEKGNAVLLEAEETKLQRLEEMRKKEGEKQKALAITQAVIQTSLSVMQALSSTAPPYSYILAAISAAAGAVQIGLIASQTFAKGGYTGDGILQADETGERPVGIVHEKEFVFDRQTTAKNRSIFEYIHKNKINLNDMFKANQLGNFGGITIDKSIELNELKNEIAELKQIMRGLPERMPRTSVAFDSKGFAMSVGQAMNEQSLIKNNIHA